MQSSPRPSASGLPGDASGSGSPPATSLHQHQQLAHAYAGMGPGGFGGYGAPLAPGQNKRLRSNSGLAGLLSEYGGAPISDPDIDLNMHTAKRHLSEVSMCTCAQRGWGGLGVLLGLGTRQGWVGGMGTGRRLRQGADGHCPSRVAHDP